MDKTISYALILSIIFIVCFALPGIIILSCGYPYLIASAGIAISIILYSKSYVSHQIWGESSYQHSAPVIGTLILCISAIKGVISFYNLKILLDIYESYGIDFTEISLTSKEALNKTDDIIIVSIFWGIVIFLNVLFIAYYRRKHPIKKINEFPFEILKIGDTINTDKNKYIFKGHQNGNLILKMQRASS